MGFANRERERARALQDAVALIHNRKESPQADGHRTVPECGSPLPLSVGTGRERTRRSVPRGARESRAREDSRTPGRCRAHPEIVFNDGVWDVHSFWKREGVGLLRRWLLKRRLGRMPPRTSSHWLGPTLLPRELISKHIGFVVRHGSVICS